MQSWDATSSPPWAMNADRLIPSLSAQPSMAREGAQHRPRRRSTVGLSPLCSVAHARTARPLEVTSAVRATCRGRPGWTTGRRQLGTRTRRPRTWAASGLCRSLRPSGTAPTVPAPTRSRAGNRQWLSSAAIAEWGPGRTRPPWPPSASRPGVPSPCRRCGGGSPSWMVMPWLWPLAALARMPETRTGGVPCSARNSLSSSRKLTSSGSRQLASRTAPPLSPPSPQLSATVGSVPRKTSSPSPTPSPSVSNCSRVSLVNLRFIIVVEAVLVGVRPRRRLVGDQRDRCRRRPPPRR